MAQGALVSPDPQVEALEQRVEGERDDDHEGGGRGGEGRDRRLGPRDRGRRRPERQRRPEGLARERREEAEVLDLVTPLRHVRDRPAVEVTVIEPGDLRAERRTEAHLQLPAQPEQAAHHPELGEQKQGGEGEERHDCKEPLRRPG